MISLLIAISTFSLVVCGHFYNKSLLEELNLRMEFIFSAEIYLNQNVGDVQQKLKMVDEGNMDDLLKVLDDVIIYGETMEQRLICMDLFKLKKRCDIIMFASCGACIGNAVAMFIF